MALTLTRGMAGRVVPMNGAPALHGERSGTRALFRLSARLNPVASSRDPSALLRETMTTALSEELTQEAITAVLAMCSSQAVSY